MNLTHSVFGILKIINDMGKKIICVNLNDKQQKMYEEWLSHIKALYNQHGTLTWKITPTSVGDEISVYSELAKVELDLTDLDSW